MPIGIFPLVPEPRCGSKDYQKYDFVFEKQVE